MISIDKMNKICISFSLIFIIFAGCEGETLRIGALFQGSDTYLETAFRLAVDIVNQNSELLPNHEIEYVSDNSDLIGAYDSWQKVCYLMEQNITTVIGPMTSTAVKAAHPMSLGLNMPMISPTATDPMLVDDINYQYLLRIFPSDTKQSRALVDFFKYFNWDTVAILTDNTDYGINGLVEFQTLAAENKWRVLSVQQFVASKNESEVDAVSQLQTIKGTGARIILLNCAAFHALKVFEQAQEEGMMQSGWVWMVTDGVSGFNTLPEKSLSEPYLEGILGVRPISNNGSLYESFTQAWNDLDSANPLPAASLAFHDAVIAYAHAMHQMLETDGQSLSTTPLSCLIPDSEPWQQGLQVLDYLKNVNTQGAMNHLQFNKNGGPLHVSFEYVRLGSGQWIKHGSWVDRYGVNVNTTDLTSFEDRQLFSIKDYGGDLVNRTLRVAVVVDPPYVFKGNETSDGDACRGNDCFSGYAIDLLTKIATDLKFQFELYEVPDGRYGKIQDDGTWNGLMGELSKKNGRGEMNADLGIGAFTISYEREKDISFTKPFGDHRLGILIGTKSEQTYNAFSFLTPLSNEVWGWTIGTALIVGLVINLLDKLSPYGHHGKKGQIDNELEHEAMDRNDDGTVDYWEMKEWESEKHTMSFHNAMLWALASLFEQGAERHPKSWSARIAAAAWWIGALIIIQSYTANLAAFLTIKNKEVGIQSIYDLVTQVEDVVRYGTVKDSHVHDFLESSNREPYTRIITRINDWGTLYNTTEEIVEHVNEMDGTFAFLYDLPVLDYWKGQAADCGLAVLPNGFANFGFGFGLPKDSIYQEELTLKIYKLRESGYMDTLDHKWLIQTAACVETSAENIGEGENERIGMPSLWGAFWAVYVAFGISFLVMILEWNISAVASVNKADSSKPQTVFQAFKHRLGILRRDIKENWFPINFNKAEIKRKESTIRPMASGLQMRLLRVAATAALLSKGAQQKSSNGKPEVKKNGVA